MKSIEVDDELYFYIASQTRHIGESASDILRRLLPISGDVPHAHVTVPLAQPSVEAGSVVSVDDVAGGELLQRIDAQPEETSIARFIHILGCLYHDRQQAFIAAAALKGRTRVYLSRTQDELLETGKTTKPKPISGTPYWVITNTNTKRKRNILLQLMENMGYSAPLIEVVCSRI